MSKNADKKLKDAEAKKAALALKQRLEYINEFNRQNMGSIWIDPAKAPTEDDVKKAEQNLKDANVEIQSSTYLIADADNAKRIAEFLRKFMSECFWVQGYYQGVIEFKKYIDAFLEDYDKEACELRMDFGPMNLCFTLLTNFAGFGIEAAQRMADMQSEYQPIYEIFKHHMETWQDGIHGAQHLQKICECMANGFYAVDLIKAAAEANTVPGAEINTAEASEDNAKAYADVEQPLVEGEEGEALSDEDKAFTTEDLPADEPENAGESHDESAE